MLMGIDGQPEVLSETLSNNAERNFTVGAVDRISQVLRGEISAIEAYEHVLVHFAAERNIHKLEEIKDQHEEAAHFWTQILSNSGFEAERHSGPWGQVVRTFVDTATFFGDTSSLRALHAGETHGLSEYYEMLADSTVPSGLKDKVRSVFIPAQEQHIALLDAWKAPPQLEA